MRKQLATAAVVFCLSLFPLTVRTEPMTINFRDVELRQIIETVGELTGRNFLIDPRVKGKVTILANEEVPEEALYDVLLSVLRLHGFSAIEGANLTRIVPRNQGARFPPGPAREDLVTEIIGIRNLGAATIIPLVRPLMTQQAQVVAHKETNVLILSEIRANIERVKEIIAKIDLKSLADYDLIQLHHTEAEDLVKILQRVSNKNLKHLVQIISDKEQDRVILTGPESVRLPLRALIAELDTPISRDTIKGRLVVIPLKHAKADDLEDIIRSLLNSKFLEGGFATVSSDAKKTDAKADAKKKDEKKDDKKQDDKKQDDKKKTAASTSANKGSKYTLQSDPATNSLIVGGQPVIIDLVRQLVRELDVPRPQVLIEAILAEISADKSAQLSARFSPGNDADGEDGPIPASYSGLLALFSSGDGAVGALGFQSGGRSNPFYLLINALRNNDESEVLATPSVLTLNNEKAILDVSDERSIQTGEFDRASDRTFNTFERRRFGTRLEVEPQITEGDAVRLDIKQKLEDVSNESGTNAQPNTQTREIETKVVVKDGDILVLGGLTRRAHTFNRNDVPGLSSLPLLGHLFKGRDQSRERLNVMIFIRPTILRTAEDGADVSRARYAELRLRHLMHVSGHDSLLAPDREEATALPQLKERKKKKKRSKRRRDDARRRDREPRTRRTARDDPIDDLFDTEPRRKKKKRRLRRGEGDEF